MKTKKSLLVLMAIALVLVFTACGGGDGGGNSYNNNNETYGGEKKITITELPSKYIGMAVEIEIYGNDVDFAVKGADYVSNSGSVTVSLGETKDGHHYNMWTKSGLFYVSFSPNLSRSFVHYYSDGKTWENMGLTNPLMFMNWPFDSEYLESLPKVSITNEVTIIPFNKFISIE